MYVKVRTMDGSQTAMLTISKLTSVNDFRQMVDEKLKVPPERQRLFYRGKQMEDGYSMFDYGININDVIQLMPKQVLGEIDTNTPSKTVSTEKKKSEPIKEDSTEEKNETKKEEITRESKHYRNGDLVDAKYGDGSWWEAAIVDITIDEEVTEATYQDDGMKYHVKFEKYEEDEPLQLSLDYIRPRAHKKVQLEDVNPGDNIMVNYNIDEPEKRGHWYDCKVKKVFLSKSRREIISTIQVSDDDKPINDCKITLVNELFTINKHIRLAVRDGVPETETIEDSPVKGNSGSPNCNKCKDNKGRKCKECGCHKCGGKDNPDKQLMCDECDQAFHLYCLDPPLDALPDVDEWYCHLCKNDETEIVRLGEGLKHSKKKSQMPSSKGTGRDWGKGFACAGRQKSCNLVPPNFFGPIPGVEVGTCWKFRINVSESGVHRPPVAGIAGRESEGAQSVVLAGGYEDDIDDGDKFTYTGSGGRDLSGNKRTAEQSMDQELTRMNKALALNVNARLNKEGAEAEDWKGGKPVRVIRNSKGRKHSEYAPEEGNRYDGIYKIVKYWPEKGKSGFKVWRYLFRRDDPSPAPWTKKGKKHIEELGLTMIYPEGYLEAQAEKEKEKEKEKAEAGSDSESDEEVTKKKKRKNKRKSKGANAQSESEDDENKSPPSKKKKTCGYKLEKDLADLIEKDTENVKIWDECKETLPEGKVKFVAAVEEHYLCICCQEVAYKPITTPCIHNVCQACLQRSFNAAVYSCPACRHDLGEKFSMDVNKNLQAALVAMFPGYEMGR